MTTQTQYIIDETRWLLSFGRPALEIAKQLDRSPQTLWKIGRDHELEDIRVAFSPYSSRGRKA